VRGDLKQGEREGGREEFFSGAQMVVPAMHVVENFARVAASGGAAIPDTVARAWVAGNQKRPSQFWV